MDAVIHGQEQFAKTRKEKVNTALSNSNVSIIESKVERKTEKKIEKSN